jgi:hypothetical protein
MTERLAATPSRSPDQPTIAPLWEAVADGNARFGASPVLATTAKGITKLQRRLGIVFAGFPGIAIGRDGVQHTARSGMYFARLHLGGDRGYLAALGESHAQPIRPGRDVIAVTGRCLFGLGAIVAWPGPEPLALLQVDEHFIDPADPIKRVEVDKRLHLYEAEGTARCGAFLRDLQRLPGIGTVHVWADLPTVPYQLHGLSLHQRGLMTAGAYAAYREAITERGQMVTAALAAELDERSPLTRVNAIGWADRVRIKPGRDPGAALWAAARRRSWARWRRDGRLWAALRQVRPGDALMDLIHASYQHVYLSASAEAARRGAALVFVDDVEEEFLFRASWPAARAARLPLAGQAVAFYLHPDYVALDYAPGTDGHYLYNVPDGCDWTLA